MSVAAVSWVLENSPSRQGDRLVLFALATHANADGTKAWPSVATLVAETLMCERQVQYSLRALEQAGEISRTGFGPKRTNCYTIIMKGAPDCGGAVECTGAVECGKGVQSSAPEPTTEPFLVEAKASTPPKKTQRKRDELWEVLVEEIGPVANAAERGKYNAALKLIREAEATPDDLRQHIVAYRRLWPEITITALAVAKNWSLLEANGNGRQETAERRAARLRDETLAYARRRRDATPQ